MNSQRGTLSGLRKNPSSKASYDSLLERDYMIELEQDPSVKSWTKEHNIKIPYTFLSVFTRNYLPDFLIEYNDGNKELHEGKGLPLLFWDSTKQKRESAQEWCRKHGMRYKVVTLGRQIFYINNFIENAGIKDSNNFAKE